MFRSNCQKKFLETQLIALLKCRTTLKSLFFIPRNYIPIPGTNESDATWCNLEDLIMLCISSIECLLVSIESIHLCFFHLLKRLLVMHSCFRESRRTINCQRPCESQTNNKWIIY